MIKPIKFLGYSLPLLMLGMLTACEEQTDWNFQSLENGALVVEAIITDEFKRQEVLLSLSTSGLNDEAPPVSSAEVRVVGEGKTFFFREDFMRPGRYVSEKIFPAQSGVVYTLEIDWNGTTYLAEAEMADILPFERMTFQPAGTDSLSIKEVAPLYLPHEQAMYEVDLFWAHLANEESARAKLFFYTFNTIDINELFRPSQETVVFPKGSIVREKKYSLHPEFAAYLRALLMETEWQGGVFDEASGSLPTNISKGGLGFFAVCAVLNKTFIAE